MLEMKCKHTFSFYLNTSRENTRKPAPPGSRDDFFFVIQDPGTFAPIVIGGFCSSTHKYMVAPIINGEPVEYLCTTTGGRPPAEHDLWCSSCAFRERLCSFILCRHELLQDRLVIPSGLAGRCVTINVQMAYFKLFQRRIRLRDHDIWSPDARFTILATRWCRWFANVGCRECVRKCDRSLIYDRFTLTAPPR